MESIFCSVTYPDRTGYNTMGTSVFDAAANALRWSEIDCRDFGTARRFRDDEVLRIGVGMVPDRWYRVRIGRVRQWETELSKPAGRIFLPDNSHVADGDEHCGNADER